MHAIEKCSRREWNSVDDNTTHNAYDGGGDGGDDGVQRPPRVAAVLKGVVSTAHESTRRLSCEKCVILRLRAASRPPDKKE